jgi:2'-5' RNA ligase
VRFATSNGAAERTKTQLSPAVRPSVGAARRRQEAAVQADAITDYVDNMGHWHAWQREYRYGVLLLLPPEPIATAVGRIRELHDPRSQASCGAHISLTVPLPGPMTTEQWRELEQIAVRLPPFEIRYGPLSNYLPHPGVVLAIAPQGALDALRASLEAATAFVGATPRSHPFSAHMTIAEFVTVEQTIALTDELAGAVPPGAFVCEYVSYVVPDESFAFSERGRLWLGRPAR